MKITQIFTIETFILTEYFYEVIALEIDIENEHFKIEYQVSEEADIFSYALYEGIEIISISHKGKEVDLNPSHFAEIEIELYDEIIEQYYQLIAEQNQNK